MVDYVIRTSHGPAITVPNDLNAITTHVLLEQEQWFEREVEFVRSYLKPGMTVLDIGANLGIYALTMAAKVAPGGKVYAFEPAASVREKLEATRRLNRAENLVIIPAALADEEKEGWLDHGNSSELNAIGEGGGKGPGETIRISTLGIQEKEQGWPTPDFMKIDAEGAEAQILTGAPEFFRRHSPLIMYEVKAGATQNVGLQDLFADFGYESYRLLGTAPILVPVERGEALDGYELNLFAAKEDRAQILIRDQWLVRKPEAFTPTPATRARGLSFFSDQPFAAGLQGLISDPDRHRADYLDALGAYAVWRDRTASAAVRVGALLFAHRTLKTCCAESPQAVHHSTFARVALELGDRVGGIDALSRLGSAMAAGTQLEISAPFFPPSARFDMFGPGERFGEWFIAATVETLEKSTAYSSMFGQPNFDPAWTATLPFTSTEMLRRKVLGDMRAGRRPDGFERLLTPAPDHLNADFWQRLLAPVRQG